MLLTIKQAAEYLAMSPSGIRRLVRSGTLPSYKMSAPNNPKWGRVKFSKKDLDEYIEKHRKELNTPARKYVKKKPYVGIFGLSGK